MQVLSFEDGWFILSSSSDMLAEDLWTRIPTPPLSIFFKYKTKNLRAAAFYRPYADKTAEQVISRRFAKSYDLIPLDKQLLSFLDPHQIKGVEWILTRSRSYLAHSPGAGKTVTSITASLLTQGEGQILFIVPPSLTMNWAREIKRFAPLVVVNCKLDEAEYKPTIAVVPRSNKQNTMSWHAHFIICPDSMLTAPWVHQKLLDLRFKFIAVDEASRFKEPSSARSLHFYGGRHKGINLPGLFRNARHTVMLDGSPITSRAMDLWAPCYALDPESISCMTRDEFGMRYCGPRFNSWGVMEYKHSSNEAELSQKITKRFMHVVKESELSHPERLRSILFMNQDVRSLEQKTWEKTHLSKLALTDISEERSQGDLARFRKQLGLGKISWIAQYIKDRLKNTNESILVFAHHIEVVEGIAKALGLKSSVVRGGMKEHAREQIFTAFQSGKIRVIVGNIQAMGRGQNLQRADRVVFGEYAWSDETNRQCEKRASRRGSTKEFVRADYIVLPNSLDEVVLQAVFRKQKMVGDIVK